MNVKGSKHEGTGYSSSTKRAESGDLLGNVAVAQWFQWNVHMDAGNIEANAKASFSANGVTVDSQTGTFIAATGPNQQTVTFFSAITTDGPLSFLVLTVGSINNTDAQSLRDALEADIKHRIGL